MKSPTKSVRMRKRLRHPRGKPASRIENKFQKLSDPKIRRQQYLLSIWTRYTSGTGRKPTEEDIAELRKIGWLQKQEKTGTNGEYPKKVTGQPAMASLINHKFKITCNRKIIQNWRKRPPVPFPAPDDRGDYVVQECFDWVERCIIKNAASNGEPDLFAQASEAELKGKIEREKFEHWEREKERGGWIELVQHESILASAGNSSKAITRDAMEIQLPKVLAGDLGNIVADKELLGRILESVRINCRKGFDQWQAEIKKRFEELEAAK
jgi:hypothetical protein